MGLILGLLTSLSITGAEFFGRRISIEVGPIVAALAASALAAVTALAVAAVDGGAVASGDLGLGALSGVGFGAGIALYLHGLRVSTAALVTPTVAGLAAVIPFVATAGGSGGVTPWSGAGLVVTVAGLALVGVGGGRVAGVRTGLPVALASGVGYGVGALVLVDVDPASGSWPIVAQRVAATLAIAGYAVARRRPLIPPRRLAGRAVGAGILAGASSLFLLAGLAIDPPAAAVAASLFPASSVVMGRLVFGDRVTALQVLGLGAVLVGIVAIALA